MVRWDLAPLASRWRKAHRERVGGATLTVDIFLLAFPVSRLHEGLETLARRAGLSPRSVTPPPAPRDGAPAELERWVLSTAGWLGLEAQAVECRYPELKSFLRGSGPSVLRLPGEQRADEPCFLLLLRGSSRHVLLLGTDLGVHRVPLDDVAEALCHEIELPIAKAVGALLDRAGISARRRGKARSALVRERLGRARVAGGWLLRSRPGATFRNQAREARLPGFLAMFAGAHTVDYGLWILSWWVLGRGALAGRLDWGWLLAWGLLLLTLIPFRVLAVWYQGRFAVAAGSLLKRRLLHGAMRLQPDEIRHLGAGHHLGRVMESEAVESLALSGGFLGLGAGIELVLATTILALGAGGIFHAFLLVVWLALAAAMGWRYFLLRREWTQNRLGISHELIEQMVGHRTRLAQQRPERWHAEEDPKLARYLELSRRMDGNAALIEILPRGWLAVGLLGIAPGFVWGQTSLVLLAVGLGGTILAHRSLYKLVDGFSFLADAGIAWTQVAPLFHSAAREESPGDPSLTATAAAAPAGAGGDRGWEETNHQPVLEATDLLFRYPERGEPVLQGLSFRFQAGDRVLLESPSGGGKSTLVSLLNGLRDPNSGLLLLHGLDRLSVGSEAWTRRVASAPQFHENHVITETFAFNLLMGRCWPPYTEDLEEAEALCRELGLGELLDRMPAGMLQMVGDTGWQLSHGEKSRLFTARALLQGGEIVILDETFAALDPDRLLQALRCALNRAPTLLLIAHP